MEPHSARSSWQRSREWASIACHQPTGIGLPPVFPPLAGSEWVFKDASIAVRNIVNYQLCLAYSLRET
jgi:hypothetical protein